MKIAQEPDLLLNLLKEHEESLAKLYMAYAERFIEYHNFWEELSKEETQHAQWLNNLQVKIKDGSDGIVLERFAIAAVETSLKFVNKSISRAVEGELELITALSTALYLEEALIDNKYFEVLDGESEEVKHTLQILSNDTKKHHRKIREVWQENR